MKKYNTIKPTGLKGNQVTERMRKLMNIAPMNEGVARSVVELTKMGPDGNVYAIIRENHNYFIKVSESKSDLVTEDFQYMGGLKNKMNESYPTYAKAIKRLSLKFISLNEANDVVGVVDTFHNDNLVTERSAGSIGFVQEDEIEETEMDVVTEEDVDMTENEEAIDEMIDPNGKKAKEDKENSGDNLAGGLEKNHKGEVASSTNTGKGDRGTGHDTHVKNTSMKISEAVANMDSIIDEISGVDTKLEGVLEGLSDADKAIVMEALKKSVTEDRQPYAQPVSCGLGEDEEPQNGGYNLDETKYKLKVDSPASEPDFGSEEGGDFGGEEADLDFGAGDEEGFGDEPTDDDGGGEDPFDKEPFDAGVESDEDEDPEKFIQQLSGKLGSSLRKYNDERGEPDFDLEKFAINSVISATHTSEMDSSDQKDIIRKVKTSGVEPEDDSEGGEEDMDFGDEEGGDEPTDDGGGDLDFGGGEEGGLEETGGPYSDDYQDFSQHDQEQELDPNFDLDAALDTDSYLDKIADSGMEPDYQWEGDSKFGKDERWENGDPMWENKLNESLDKLEKFTKFVGNKKIINKLREHHDMTYTDYGQADNDEYMAEPMTEPKPKTKPQVVPEENPPRKKRTWQPKHDQPSKNPKVDPKAGNGLIDDDIVMI